MDDLTQSYSELSSEVLDRVLDKRVDVRDEEERVSLSFTRLSLWL